MKNESAIVKELREGLGEEAKSESGQKFNVTEMASSVGSFYERLRNVIDYKDEHLLRRNAIERILSRRLSLPNGESTGSGLVKEMMWAQYLSNETVGIGMAADVDRVVSKYRSLLANEIEWGKGDEIRKWIIGVMSTEVDELLVDQRLEESLNRAMFRWMKERIKFPVEYDGKELDTQIFLAVRRSLFKEDTSTVRYHLLLAHVPEWKEASHDVIERFGKNFRSLYEKIEEEIRNPLNRTLSRGFASFAPPFLIIRDMVGKDVFFESLGESEELEYQIEKACERRYLQTRKKLGRSIFRSTIYIFLTKMMLAYILEMPADLYLYGRVHLLPLMINVMFPPTLMYLVGSSIKVPGKDNTEKIKQMLSDICYGEHASSWSLPRDLSGRRPLLQNIFWVIYIVGFAFSYGVIVYFLDKLGFGLASGGLFLFFLSVVSFFAYRIRSTAREYMVVGQRDGVASAAIDFFMLPFLRMGSWLSSEFAKINVFMFVFDFIIEAPFKAFIEVAEDWLRFLKQKKEEIV